MANSRVSHLLPDSDVNDMHEHRSGKASGIPKQSLSKKYTGSKAPAWRTCAGGKTKEAGGRQINIKLDAATNEQLIRSVEHYGCNVSTFVSTALLTFLDKYGVD